MEVDVTPGDPEGGLPNVGVDRAGNSDNIIPEGLTRQLRVLSRTVLL